MSANKVLYWLKVSQLIKSSCTWNNPLYKIIMEMHMEINCGDADCEDYSKLDWANSVLARWFTDETKWHEVGLTRWDTSNTLQYKAFDQ